MKIRVRKNDAMLFASLSHHRALEILMNLQKNIVSSLKTLSSAGVAAATTVVVICRQNNLIGFCLYIECIHGDIKRHNKHGALPKLFKCNIDHTQIVVYTYI